mmetsp:Transcript_56384/g.145163  ORF Transcript_56384/g.145163 Transcript_56384/m.145163 type:complete len:317 (+) Transcript_56384:1163-2113(+)
MLELFQGVELDLVALYPLLFVVQRRLALCPLHLEAVQHAREILCLVLQLADPGARVLLLLLNLGAVLLHHLEAPEQGLLFPAEFDLHLLLLQQVLVRAHPVLHHLHVVGLALRGQDAIEAVLQEGDEVLVFLDLLVLLRQHAGHVFQGLLLVPLQLLLQLLLGCLDHLLHHGLLVLQLHEPLLLVRDLLLVEVIELVLGRLVRALHGGHHSVTFPSLGFLRRLQRPAAAAELLNIRLVLLPGLGDLGLALLLEALRLCSHPALQSQRLGAQSFALGQALLDLLPLNQHRLGAKQVGITLTAALRSAVIATAERGNA